MNPLSSILHLFKKPNLQPVSPGSVSIHTLYWPNVDERIVQAHRAVVGHFGIEVVYRHEQIRHGLWLDEVMQTTNSEVVGFLDIDCVPTTRQATADAIDFCRKTKSFIGIAQVANHIGLKNHIYAGPAFFFIHRQAWLDLRCPTFLERRKRWDVGEYVSIAAEERGFRYKALYPTHFERIPDGGVWNLHNFGAFGIGTTFDGGVYHLYQGRRRENVDLFAERCKQITDGTFSTNSMFDARDFGVEPRC